MQTNTSRKTNLAEPGEDQDSRTINRVLATLRLVDSPPEEAFDKYTRLVTRFFGVPVAFVSIV